MTTTKTQSKDSKKSLTAGNLKTPPRQKPLKLNLVHCIFIHGMLSDLYHHSIDEKFLNFLHDMIELHENIIEKSDNEKMKTEMQYKPFNPSKNETKTQQDGSTKPKKKLQKK